MNWTASACECTLEMTAMTSQMTEVFHEQCPDDRVFA